MWVEWMRYAGWILTCPVLLMTLVSVVTTEDAWVRDTGLEG